MNEFVETLWQEFAAESDEHLAVLEPLLVRLGSVEGEAGDVARLFRGFHSLKGLARAMSLYGMEAWRIGRKTCSDWCGMAAGDDPRVLDGLLEAVDSLKGCAMRSPSGGVDAPAEPELIERLATVFAQSGGMADAEVARPAAAHTAAAALHDDPEMLAIFGEMLEARGPELCAALADDPSERAGALDAAETLTHAAEVMNFAGLAAGLAGLRDGLRRAADADRLVEPMRQDLLARLADIRLQIGLVGEATGKESGAAAFSAALTRRIGDEPRRLASELAALNRRLRDDLAEPDHLAAEADAAAMTRLARTLSALSAALLLDRTAQAMLLVEDICGRIASGEAELPDALLEAAGDLFAHLVARAEPGRRRDLDEREAAQLLERLRTPLLSTAQRALQAGGRLGRRAAPPARAADRPVGREPGRAGARHRRDGLSALRAAGASRGGPGHRAAADGLAGRRGADHHQPHRADPWRELVRDAGAVAAGAGRAEPGVAAARPWPALRQTAAAADRYRRRRARLGEPNARGRDPRPI